MSLKNLLMVDGASDDNQESNNVGEEVTGNPSSGTQLQETASEAAVVSADYDTDSQDDKTPSKSFVSSLFQGLTGFVSPTPKNRRKQSNTQGSQTIHEDAGDVSVTGDTSDAADNDDAIVADTDTANEGLIIEPTDEQNAASWRESSTYASRQQTKQKSIPMVHWTNSSPESSLVEI